MEVKCKLSDGRKFISTLQSFLPSTTFTSLFLFPFFYLTAQMPQGYSHGKGQEHNSRAIKWGCFRRRSCQTQRSLLSTKQWHESPHLNKFILVAATAFEKNIKNLKKDLELLHTLWNPIKLRNIKISVII